VCRAEQGPHDRLLGDGQLKLSSVSDSQRAGAVPARMHTGSSVISIRWRPHRTTRRCRSRSRATSGGPARHGRLGHDDDTGILWL